VYGRILLKKGAVAATSRVVFTRKASAHQLDLFEGGIQEYRFVYKREPDASLLCYLFCRQPQNMVLCNDE